MDTEHVLLAWATPVDASNLGARIEAYCATKAALFALNLCLQKPYASSTFTGNYPHLPLEVFDIIAMHARDAAFDERSRDWRKLHECLSGRCCASSHFERCEMEAIYHEEDLPPSDYESDDGSLDSFWQETMDDLSQRPPSQERHLSRVAKHIAKITGSEDASNRPSRFSRCKKVILHPLQPLDDSADYRLDVCQRL